MTRFPPAFYRAGAAASFLSVVSTLLLIFLPDFYGPAEGFDGRMRRVVDPAYLWRSWVYLAHPFIVFTAALAVAVRLRARPALVLPGAAGFALWASVEAGQQCMTLFMFDPWRRAWLAGDADVRATMQIRTALYDGLWDFSYWLLLIGFLIGCVFYAAALLRMGGLSRLVGAFYAAVAILAVTIFVDGLGGPALPPLLDRWLYPAIQPLGRFLVGLWLWKYACEGTLRNEMKPDEVTIRE